MQATSLTPDQVRAVLRFTPMRIMGDELSAGEPVDCRNAFPGKITAHYASGAPTCWPIVGRAN